MRRRATLELESPVSASLHPMVQSTLGCMDVGLDEELSRYRRSRRLAQLQERSGLDSTSKTYTIAANANPTRFKTEAASSLHLPVVPQSLRSAEGAAAPPIAVQGYAAETVSQGQAKTSAGLSSMPDEEDPSEYLESSEQLLRSLADDEPRLRRPQPSMLSTLITPLGLGSMLLLLLTSVTFGYLLMNPATIAGLNWFRSNTSGETATTGNDAGTSSSGATSVQPQPPGLGPNLSSQEFRDVNLGTLSTLPDRDGVRPGTTTPLPGQQPEIVAGTEAATSSAANQERTITRIGTEEELSTVERLAEEQRRPAGAATAPSARTSEPARQETETARPQSSTPDVSAPAARTSDPSPAPAPARTTPAAPVATAPSPSRATSDPFYYVVTDYTSDRALDKAREAVPDAFVRNSSSGAVVQFGAFSESNRAESLVQELQQQGISARVYRADN